MERIKRNSGSGAPRSDRFLLHLLLVDDDHEHGGEHVLVRARVPGSFRGRCLGLLGAGTILAAGLLAIFSPSTIAQLFSTTQTMSKLTVSTAQESINEAVKHGFASGTLTASVGLAAILGAIGGLLGLIGAIPLIPQEAPRRRLTRSCI